MAWPSLVRPPQNPPLSLVKICSRRSATFIRDRGVYGPFRIIVSVIDDEFSGSAVYLCCFFVEMQGAWRSSEPHKGGSLDASSAVAGLELRRRWDGSFK